MRTTRLIQRLEAQMNGISMSVYLHMKKNVGWSDSDIQADLLEWTGILVGRESIWDWTNKLGYGIRQSAGLAWKRNLVEQVDMDALYQPEPRVTRYRSRAG